MASFCIVLPCRAGDIILALPIAKYLADKGNTVHWVAHAEFRNLFDGVSYVKPLLFDGDMSDVEDAERLARFGMPGTKRLILRRAHGDKTQGAAHFDLDIWRRASEQLGEDLTALRETAAPLFDRRDEKREAELCRAWGIDSDKPVLLYNFSASISTKHPQPAAMAQWLEQANAGRMKLVECCRAKRLYDLIGVMERCKVLVTVDTALTHLARATSCLVVDIVADDEYRQPAPAPQIKAMVRVSETMGVVGRGKLATAIWGDAPPRIPNSSRFAAMAKRLSRPADGDIALLVTTYPEYASLLPGAIGAIERHWPDCPPLVVGQSERMSLPARMLEDLTELKSEFVVVMHEDYWLSGPVDQYRFDQCLQAMRDDQGLLACSLTWEPCDSGCYHFAKQPYSDLFEVLPAEWNYACNFQMRIWRREALISILRKIDPATSNGDLEPAATRVFRAMGLKVITPAIPDPPKPSTFVDETDKSAWVVPYDNLIHAGRRLHLDRGDNAGSIGIGITTHNRREMALKAVREIVRNSSGARIVVVDDGSNVPFPAMKGVTVYRHEKPQGINIAKNRCLELLDGCSHVFLYDDDCWPVKAGWHEPYVRSAVPHLCYSWDTFDNGVVRETGKATTVKIAGETFRCHRWPSGVMLYVRHDVLRQVGGFDPRYQRWGHEHVGYSSRIHNAGLTPHLAMDVEDSGKLFMALDRASHAVSDSSITEPERVRLGNINRPIFHLEEHEDCWKPYKVQDFCLGAYLTGMVDPQRGTAWQCDYEHVRLWAESCQRAGLVAVLFANELELPNMDWLKIIRVAVDDKTRPYWLRWGLAAKWLETFRRYVRTVWATDTLDVEVLNRPQPEAGKLYVGDEDGEVTDCPWMKSAGKNSAAFQTWIKTHAGRPLLNCGVVGGDPDRALDLLKRMAAMEDAATPLEMPAFNIVASDMDVVYGRNVTTRFKRDERTAAWIKHK